MTKEERQLLLKDLSARLPYGVKCLRSSWNYEWDQEISVVEVLENIDKFGYIDYHKVYKVDDIKPYLRPMSSMTEEEKKDFGGYIHTQPITHQQGYKGYTVNCSHYYTVSEIDWLNEHHFDYHGLIEKGLALEAPKGMYKTE